MVFEMDYNQVLENVQVNNIVLAAAGDGVISGLDVSQRAAGVNRSVDVATGSAIIAGTTYTESSIVNLAIAAADLTHARKDLVIYDVATTHPLVITGTPTTPPVPPDITTGDLLLAIVDVAANETEITNSEITDCLVEITKLDELAAPSDNTTLDCSTSAHGLLKKLNNSNTQYLNGQGNWTTPGGAGDMSKSTYDTDDDGVVDNSEQLGGRSAGYSNGDIPINSGTLCSTLNADQVDGAHAGNASGNVGLANGTRCIDLNADRVDGCEAGAATGNVWKIPAGTMANIYQHSGSGLVTLGIGTSGYQLTSNGSGSYCTWAAASDLIFSDTHCPKCVKEFQDGDDLVLHVIGHNEAGDILTIPMHLACANEPKKQVMLKRKIMDDHYILDEATGELVIQRVSRMRERLVTRHKLKEGYAIDETTGKTHKLNIDGTMQTTEQALSTAIEEVNETMSEPEYEDVEYTI